MAWVLSCRTVEVVWFVVSNMLADANMLIGCAAREYGTQFGNLRSNAFEPQGFDMKNCHEDRRL